MASRYDELVQQARDAYNARDPEAWVAIWTTDCEWHPFLTARVEGDPGYHGHNGMRAWFEDVDEMFSTMHVELEAVREAGDRLLVLGQMTAVGRGSGAEVSSEVAWVIEPRGDQLRRGWAYDSHADAERAAEQATH
jgi:ketosteroid isomerase-like protein